MQIHPLIEDLQLSTLKNESFFFYTKSCTRLHEHQDYLLPVELRLLVGISDPALFAAPIAQLHR